MCLHMQTLKLKVYFSITSNLLDKIFQLPEILKDTQKRSF